MKFLQAITGGVDATFGTVTATTLTLTNALTQAKSHASPDTDSATSALHHTLGTGANQAAAGNDSRLSDTRTPSNDANLVHLTGTETITGAKTFTQTLVSNVHLEAVQNIYSAFSTASQSCFGACGPSGQMGINLYSDTNLYRNAAGVLKTDGALSVTGATTLSSTLAVTSSTTLSSTLVVAGATYIGSGSVSTDGNLIMNAGSGATNYIQFTRAGVNYWNLYDANSTLLYLRDTINSKMHVTFTPGAGAGGGSTAFNTAASVAGTLGVTGATTLSSTLSTGNITMPYGSDKSIYVGSSTNWSYSLKSEGNNFRIYDGDGTDVFKAFYGSGGATKYVSVGTNLTVVGTVTTPHVGNYASRAYARANFN